MWNESQIKVVFKMSHFDASRIIRNNSWMENDQKRVCEERYFVEIDIMFCTNDND